MIRIASLFVIPLLALAILPSRPATAGVTTAGEANNWVCNYRGKKGFTYPGYGATQADAIRSASDTCRSASDTCRSAGDAPCYFQGCTKS